MTETAEDRRINAMSPEKFKDHQGQQSARRLEIALRDCMLKILAETNSLTPGFLMSAAYGLIQDMTEVAQQCKDMQPEIVEETTKDEEEVKLGI